MRRTRLVTVVGLFGLALALAACPSKDGPPPQTGPTEEDDEGGGGDEAALTPTQIEEVQRTVNGGMSAITRCYSDELERRGDKSLQGKVVVKILIGVDQRAAKIEIGESTLEAPAVHECVRNVIQSWEFPRLPKQAWFTYPFDFSPAY